MAKTDTIQVDILISGGGAAGYSLAMALQESADRDLKIALTEAHDARSDAPSPGFDARVIALSAQSLAFFSQFSCGDEILQHCTPIEHIHVSDKGRIGQCTLHASELNVAQLGGVIALQDLGRILQQQLSPGCQRFQPDTIAQAKQHRDAVNVTLASGQQIEARLLVIAEGANSSTAALLNCPVEHHPYQQHAIVANIKLQEGHEHWAFERFTEQGPLALLPLTHDCASLVWCVDDTTSQMLLSLSDDDFLLALQESFGFRLGRFCEVSNRYCYPITLTQRQQSTMHRTVTVANSAQALHPIAGQGFNLGLRDIQILADTIAGSDDPGSYQALRRYREQRHDDRKNTVAMTDGLVRMFSNDNPVLAMGRNAALIQMALTANIRKYFAKTAMGLHSQPGKRDGHK